MYEKLYEDNKNFLAYMARRYQWLCLHDHSISFDDLMQDAFLAVVNASETYNPDKGSWLNWAGQYIRAAFLRQYGTKKPHRCALSLDAPISEDATFIDFLPGEDVDFETVAYDVRLAVDRLKNDRERFVIRRKLEGRTLAQIGAEMGITGTRAQQIQNKAYKNLKRDLDAYTRFHAYKGVKAFKRDLTSTTEAAALWRIEHAESCKTADRCRG